MKGVTGLAVVLAAFAIDVPAIAAQTRTVQPVLAFPEQGLDDPAAYQGYQTRFFRDTKGNVVQVYLDARSGRVVNLLPDAVNESVGFTARDAAGKPIRLEWGSPDAIISQVGNRRTIEYQLVANSPQVVIGWVLLGSMRVERDLGYSGRQLEAYDWPTFRQREQEELISNLDRLDPAERQRQLGYLNAPMLSVLRARVEPDIITTGVRDRRGVSAFQTTLDGKTNLQLDLSPDPRDASIMVTVPIVTFRATANRPIRFMVRVTTDAPPLTPLARDQIFNAPFLRFLNDARVAADRARGNAGKNAAAAATVSRYRQLERDVRGTELLSSKEKLMAGLPNYATYFGRDMMMTSLMMQPVWTDAMPEFVIASALRKLGPEGDVSHEEALGGQAIRENAAEYNSHMAEYFRLVRRGNRAAADTALAHARAPLLDLQKVRENYHMRDDEFQLPVVVARYLKNPAVTTARKKAFLMDSSDGRGPRVGLLMKELGLVATLAAPYARDPVVQNLIGSPRLDSTHWRSVSWRDSNAGYANGRFEMDINAIWVPRALQSISEILASLRAIGFTQGELAALMPSGKSPLGDFAQDAAFAQRAMQNWGGAARHFVVTIKPDEIKSRVAAKLQSLPAAERAYWRAELARTAADTASLEFLAISLDSAGRPIPVVNTDPATRLLLRDARDISPEAVAAVRRDVRAITRAYPVGLFVARLGPVVANDAYASPSVWEAFRNDQYHSPRVVWGREVNLILLGLANQITGSTDDGGKARGIGDAVTYVDDMRSALMQTYLAVEASGLKHNELWSYEIANGTLRPIRYGASTDVQLWNVTDLAVQFVLKRLAVY